MKRCGKCGELKEDSEFHRSRANRDGLQGYCKECQKNFNAAHYGRAAAARWRDNNRDNLREARLFKKYGITRTEWDDLLDAQGGGCAICGTPDPGKKGFHVDHDHSTGAVRGILCNTCNAGLGQFHDDSTILRRAADYLEGVHRGR